MIAVLKHLGVEDAQPVSGGCIHRCYCATRSGRAVFLKVNDVRFADAFAAEADGLAALRAAGCTAPEPISQGTVAASAYLLMEFLDLKSRGDFAALGRMLAAMHRVHGHHFGWARDNYIGSTPQPNGAYDSWAEFWRERRLARDIRTIELDGDPE